MAEPFDLDTALADVSGALAWPPTPDLVTAVAIELDGRSRSRPWAIGLRSWPRVLVIALVATLLVAATVAAAALLLPGLRLSIVPSLPGASAPADPLGTRMALGERVAASEAAAAFPAALGEPDETYVDASGDVVSLVYGASDALPEVADTGVGLLLQEIRGDLNEEMVEKLVVEVGAIVTPVTVSGAEGFWISGPPHLVRYRDSAGIERREMTRLVGDTLVWQDGEVLHRIESGIGMDAAIRIGESIPSPGTP
jgi:hypothetical protein